MEGSTLGLRLMFVGVGARWAIARGKLSEVMALSLVEYFKWVSV